MGPEEKKTITETVVSKKEPTAQRQVYIDDSQISYKPFQYQEGQSVIDVLAQAKQHKESLEEREKRTARMAKVTGWGNLFNAIAGLAGGGYTQTRYQPSPIMQQSLNQLSSIQDEKYKTDLYYQELARKTKEADKQLQMKTHYDQQKDIATLDQRRRDSNFKALNAAASDEFKAGVQTVQEKSISDYEKGMRDRAISAREASANAATMNAQTNAAEAANPATKKGVFLSYKDKSGNMRTMGKSQAQQIINDVAARYPGLVQKNENELTPVEKAIKEDITNIKRAMGSGEVEATDNLIRAVALKYIASGFGEFEQYFDPLQSNQTMQGGSPTQQPKGSFLPPKTQTAVKKNLLQ